MMFSTCVTVASGTACARRKAPGFGGTDAFIAAVEFGVCYIVQQRGQLHHQQVCFFFRRNMARLLPYPVNVPPVVAPFCRCSSCCTNAVVISMSAL